MSHVITIREIKPKFDDWIQKVLDSGEPLIVQREDQAEVVLISRPVYEQVLQNAQKPHWEISLEKARSLAEKIKQRRGGKPLTPPEDIIYQMREEQP